VWIWKYDDETQTLVASARVLSDARTRMSIVLVLAQKLALNDPPKGPRDLVFRIQGLGKYKDVHEAKKQAHDEEQKDR
jgi:hypothetical protein